MEEATKDTSSLQIPKAIQNTFNVLQKLSTKAASKLAIKTFFSPIKYPTPQREIKYKQSRPLQRLKVNGKKITVYFSGEQPYKTLLVHGWSGRASQFYKIGPALEEEGMSYISFTAPAHGSSKDKKTNLKEFIECIEFLQNHYNSFDHIVGHSLGGVAAMNIASHFPIKKVVTIGSPASILQTLNDFCRLLNLNSKVEQSIIDYIKTNFDESFEDMSAAQLGHKVNAQGLVIHDTQDRDVDVKSATQITASWPNSLKLVTNGLGHRRILADDNVINKIVSFLKEST